MSRTKKFLIALGQMVLVAICLYFGFLALYKFSIYRHHVSGNCKGEVGCDWPWCEHFRGGNFLRGLLP